ncbi:23S rRNA (pseudouridine(1915)-N(3))-methyltransferase RlmH [uncultured Litoreibacter sp.]|uniref:23S rRNA (pseudouridine(1915)-N(3))-methyltransferase RlmH n=1 Tax=uncultured Litoreibacter sp. TaxID=1392394 RepID=UPI00262BD151|nr:23S rRNA (pseudouridine(1915)-N(3))-methyltransferase RlmH [uncultured Litoreibacter sp.]
MKVTICAIGRLRAGPEFDLIKDYLQRFDRTGRNLGLGPAQIIEQEDKKGGGSVAEAQLLLRAIPKGAKVCAMDERGKVMTSPEFATMMGNWRDQGTSDMAFIIGGADGLTKELRNQADASLSLGKMVWPHMLARVMLSEQLYRAASILSGSPYHRV